MTLILVGAISRKISRVSYLMFYSLTSLPFLSCNLMLLGIQIVHMHSMRILTRIILHAVTMRRVSMSLDMVKLLESSSLGVCRSVLEQPNKQLL